MLHINFRADDLTRIRIISQPDPLWEILLSLHLLGKSDGEAVFGEWKHQVRSTLRWKLPMLSRLAPPYGYSADFLTPHAGICSLESGIDTVLSTPRRRLRTDLSLLDQQRRLPGWAGSLANGDVETLRRLGGEVRDYHRVAIAPHHRAVADHVAADRAFRIRTIAEHGVERLLSTLHATIRWQAPVLEVEYPAERWIHLDGRGLVLAPAFFCRRYPITVRDPGLPPVLVYPIEHDADWLRPQDRTRTRHLTALLGRSRAAVLEALTDHHEHTVGEIASRVGIALPTASEHTSILQEAGLLIRRRHGKHVAYSITALGMNLITGSSASSRTYRTLPVSPSFP
jgi:DNA-binding transcriptional ArsR family regulator